MAQLVQKEDALDLIQLFKSRLDQSGGGGLLPRVIVTSQSGNTVTMSKDDVTLTATESSGTWTFNLPDFGVWTITAYNPVEDLSNTKIISVKVAQIYNFTCYSALRYGFRINKNESDPYKSVEYLYDAVGMSPAKMDFTNGVFNYGDWANAWFVKNNKPCMLKSDGTVDYYLDPNDYTKKEDGETASDVANTSYDGNAMSQIPLCWVYRYEDSNYLYQIVSTVQWDENYKAYAHTDANGNIKDYFYSAMFGASGNSTKLRSFSGQSLSQKLTTAQQITGATANGSNWYIGSWSQRSLIITLLVLIGKSTNTQAVFGNGNACESTSANAMLKTGTLKNKGQFFGYSSNNQQVKVFHIEGFWGNQWIRTAGLMSYNGYYYVKMTPEGSGYRATDTNGYTKTNISSPTSDQLKFISKMNCSQYGLIPTALDGSSNTYFCDTIFTLNNQLNYLLVGGSFFHPVGKVGAFTFAVHKGASTSDEGYGCALAYV